ncbi:MAG: lytic transglycosylase F [Rhizobiaceae bacterium]|nr:lytic transglycosylase F [Rhizobiaceae bacterium]
MLGTMRASLNVLAVGLALLYWAVVAHAQDDAPKAELRDWTGDYKAMVDRRVVRVLVPYSKTIYFIDGGQQLGTAVELGTALGEWINKGRKKEIERVHIAYVPVGRNELIPALLEGRGDVVAADLTVTPSRLEQIDFSDPLASGVKEVLITGPASPSVASIDDLAGKEVFVRRTSSYFEHLTALNSERKSAGKPEIIVSEIDENLEDEDILEMVNAGLLPWAVVDRFDALIWQDVLEDIVVHDDIAISTGGDIAFGIRKGSPELKEMLAGFVKQHKIGTTFGNILKKRYYQSDKMVRRAYDGSDLARFQALRLIFETYGDEYNFEPLLLAAQGYQESKLDQKQRSPRGAVGIMQLLPSTAADKAVGVKGIDKSAERNIEAGAKYLHHLTDVYVGSEGLDPLNRMLLTLAAYNAGPGNLKKFRKAAEDMGLNPNVWFGNVENGAARIVGRETVQYVGNIYKYYIAYSMYAERQKKHDAAKEEAQGAANKQEAKP